MRWLLLVLLSLGMVIAYVDRINLSVAIAVKDFAQHFSLTDTDKGALNSAFFWSYALAQIPAGWIVDRYGSKYPFAWGFLFWSLVSAATAWGTSVWQLFAFRLVLGLCESVVTPASMRWIRYQFDEKSRGLALGIYTTGSKIGSASGMKKGPVGPLRMRPLARVSFDYPRSVAPGSTDSLRKALAPIRRPKL